MYDDATARRVLSAPISKCNGRDVLVWNAGSNGMFDCRAAYFYLLAGLPTSLGMVFGNLKFH